MTQEIHHPNDSSNKSALNCQCVHLNAVTDVLDLLSPQAIAQDSQTPADRLQMHDSVKQSIFHRRRCVA